jgi:rubrerythrin
MEADGQPVEDANLENGQPVEDANLENGQPVEDINLDEPIPDSGVFSFKKLKQLHIDLDASFKNEGTDIEMYTELYFEWTKLFAHLGRALVVAFKGKLQNASNLLLFIYRH